jgi:hypothetical protein
MRADHSRKRQKELDERGTVRNVEQLEAISDTHHRDKRVEPAEKDRIYDNDTQRRKSQQQHAEEADGPASESGQKRREGRKQAKCRRATI